MENKRARGIKQEKKNWPRLLGASTSTKSQVQFLSYSVYGAVSELLTFLSRRHVASPPRRLSLCRKSLLFLKEFIFSSTKCLVNFVPSHWGKSKAGRDLKELIVERSQGKKKTINKFPKKKKKKSKKKWWMERLEREKTAAGGQVRPNQSIESNDFSFLLLFW